MNGYELFTAIEEYIKNNYEYKHTDEEIIVVINELLEKMVNDMSLAVLVSQLANAKSKFAEDNNVCPSCRK